MKKTIYILGIVLVNLFVIGTVFKMMHFPGANILIGVGLGMMSLLFLPLALINNYRNNGKEKKSLYIIGYATVMLCLIAALFKIMHWPGAGILMVACTPLPFILFLPVFLYFNKKHEPRQSLNFVGVMLLLTYVAVFSSLLALNVSRDIITTMFIGADDFAQSTNVVQQKNEQTYQWIEQNDSLSGLELESLKQRSNELVANIENIKRDLIIKIDGEESPAFDSSGKIIFSQILNATESNTSTRIMHDNETSMSKAANLKNQLIEYRKLLLTLTKDKDLKTLISKLFDTEDKPSNTKPGETDSWEERLFPHNAFLITIEGNLNSIQNNIRMAESCIIEQYYLMADIK